MTGRVAGKSALVMGAGQSPGATMGNGRAIALLLAQEGARVFCADRDLDRAEDTVAAIRNAGGRAEALLCDVTMPEQCAEIVHSAGALDILVNNVGIGGGGDGPAHVVTADAFERILAVNLKGVLNGIAAFVPGMRERGSGSIVNISSLAGVAGAQMIAYETSKAAVNRLTLSTALANAKYGVRCNAVAPGLMDTPMAIEGHATNSGLGTAVVRAQRSQSVPLRQQMGDAWDTAYATLFLASDEAKFITGVILPVDGGMSARIG
jgi:NAD(P)-dependent dehydrogenase (short-subunit alcohol dehydrogenase family)